MEIWGGIECSLSRVGARRCDQLARSGHYSRRGDLEMLAALGIRTLRYPLLWERAATAVPGEYDWRFADERLPRIRELGITPEEAGELHSRRGAEHRAFATTPTTAAPVSPFWPCAACCPG